MWPISGVYSYLVSSNYAKFNSVNDELYVNNSEGIWIYKSLDKKPELLEWQMNRFTVSTDGNDLIRWWAPAGVEVIDIIEQKSIYYKVHTFNGQEMSWQDANFDYSKRYFLLENNKILILDRGYPLTVKENIKVKKLEVYPNPTATNIDYSYTLEENAELSIYINDIEGKTVKSIFDEYQTSGEYNGSEDISNLAQGTYFLVIESAGSISSNKFVVVK
jgi:hypothetical protein